MKYLVRLYRDDATTPVEYADVKHVFWTCDNTVLVLAQFSQGKGQGAHHYIHWPRERFAWYKVERQEEQGGVLPPPRTRPVEQWVVCPECSGRGWNEKP